jgi:putrescine transport system permease protein
VATLTVLVVSIGVVAASLWLARIERKRARETAAAAKN